MKRLLLLGGSAQQIIAIETAKRLGLYTVLCDYLPDNPGQFHADKFYQVSTTDKEAVLEIAKKEQIDCVLAYASDPAAPTMAYVAEQLCLPGNPYKSVQILCNKDRFREFLKTHGFPCPGAKSYNNKETALHDLSDHQFSFPLIIKPVDSSGSKGVTILRDIKGFEDAIDFAFSFSRSKRIIIETYIERKHEHVIGGDIFVSEGQVILWGLMSCFRGDSKNPLVPGGEMYPPQVDQEDISHIKSTLQRMVTELDIHSGSMNVEIMIGNDDQVYLVDIGPRAGGNMIPIQLGDIFGVDLVKMAIQCAMGEIVNVQPRERIPFCATYVLHSDKEGVFKGISFSEEAERYIYRKCIYKEVGDLVGRFDNAANALGILFLRFTDNDTMLRILSEMNKMISIELEKA